MGQAVLPGYPRHDPDGHDDDRALARHSSHLASLMCRSLVSALLMALLVVGRTGAASADSSDPLHTVLGDVPSFRLTERSGHSVTLEDLRGKTWVVSFFFTSCAAGCAQTQAAMKRLQDELAGVPDAVLV